MHELRGGVLLDLLGQFELHELHGRILFYDLWCDCSMYFSLRSGNLCCSWSIFLLKLRSRLLFDFLCKLELL